MRVTTFCEPQYREGNGGGYWSVEVIEEFSPNWLQRIFGAKPETKRTTYVYLTHRMTFVSSVGWREQPSGDEVDAVWGMGDRLGRYVQRHLDRIQLEQLQEEEIRRDRRREAKNA